MRVLVSGVGAVGARAARYLVADGATEQVLVHDTDRKRRDAVVRSLGERAQPIDEPDPDAADLVLLASPAARQAAVARAAVAAGRHVVSVGDSIPLVEQLLDLDAEARERGVVVAAGAGFGPGLSCVLARHAAAELDAVDEIHVAEPGDPSYGDDSPVTGELAAELLERGLELYATGPRVELRTHGVHDT